MFCDVTVVYVVYGAAYGLPRTAGLVSDTLADPHSGNARGPTTGQRPRDYPTTPSRRSACGQSNCALPHIHATAQPCWGRAAAALPALRTPPLVQVGWKYPSKGLRFRVLCCWRSTEMVG
jgi:hypothetical protein